MLLFVEFVDENRETNKAFCGFSDQSNYPCYLKIFQGIGSSKNLSHQYSREVHNQPPDIVTVSTSMLVRCEPNILVILPKLNLTQKLKADRMRNPDLYVQIHIFPINPYEIVRYSNNTSSFSLKLMYSFIFSYLIN